MPLLPGKYVLVIDGPGFVAAMDRLHPAAPEKKKSGSSFSLGFGGFSSGGGSSHRHASQEGAGPVGGGPTKGSHDNSASSGGTEAGVVADINRDGVPDSAVRPGNQGNQQGTVTFTVIFTDPPAGTDVHQGTLMFSSETPYCRDVAGQGMRFGIEIPAGGGATMTLTTRKSGHDHQEE